MKAPVIFGLFLVSLTSLAYADLAEADTLSSGLIHDFDITAKKEIRLANEPTVISSYQAPPPPDEPKGVANFVDPTKPPQSYIDRYNNEPSYKEWFDKNHGSDYSSIYEAVGLEKPKGVADFVDSTKDPQSYVDRYNNEPSYKEWFDKNHGSDYSSIYEAVGLEEPIVEELESGECGIGTQLINGVCLVTPKEPKTPPPSDTGGGCLIATAAYGSELAPQIQMLREIRDNTILPTQSGAAFMETFNQVYYTFSPTVADLERESPIFREAVKLFITPMLSTLSIMTLADSESQVLGLGISVILLNLGIYIIAPTAVGLQLRRISRY